MNLKRLFSILNPGNLSGLLDEYQDDLVRRAVKYGALSSSIGDGTQAYVCEIRDNKSGERLEGIVAKVFKSSSRSEAQRTEYILSRLRLHGLPVPSFAQAHPYLNIVYMEDLRRPGYKLYDLAKEAPPNLQEHLPEILSDLGRIHGIGYWTMKTMGIYSHPPLSPWFVNYDENTEGFRRTLADVANLKKIHYSDELSACISLSLQVEDIIDTLGLPWKKELELFRTYIDAMPDSRLREEMEARYGQKLSA